MLIVILVLKHLTMRMRMTMSMIQFYNLHDFS